MARESSTFVFDLGAWIGMTLGVYAVMSTHERAQFHRWEQTHVRGDGRFASSDWPGWTKYLPPKPVPPERKPTLKKTPIPKGLRRQVYERDYYECRYCGAR